MGTRAKPTAPQRGLRCRTFITWVERDRGGVLGPLGSELSHRNHPKTKPKHNVLSDFPLKPDLTALLEHFPLQLNRQLLRESSSLRELFRNVLGRI